ncbi:MAG: phytanoyl-CoA dioxygenase family protein [Candidatus Thiodiazotropha taylori]|nr:phytanoyl-CoA dioxygenase family protein [Candidatus Thiodiazotropha taylori]MCG8096929.1 phytanoyl-CoA dioxygenase family protein [Candidatus Thiodiazotropha endolucinida]MCG8109102.1 phytanoyl-CoA dioxygenase family protein [Candidatus Thiodiazotropha taylori]MCG8113375.1 phytanoyl-CoA dioxygenase family protein [Candidatus Thiodiazotropha taylori]MCW4281438.1 phytanoyl-CoA dioxygenase family protein [Candidatus Thiodiazotropha taylori]
MLTDIERTGFAVVPKLLKYNVVEEMRNELNRLESMGSAVPLCYEPQFEGYGEKKRLRKVRRLIWNNEEFWSSRLLPILKLGLSLVPGKPELILHAAFMKAARIGGVVEYHQDQALWDCNYPGAISVWVALTRSSVENGCIVGCPKSHLLGQLGHKSADRLYKWHPYVDLKSNQMEDIVTIELNPGDAVFWHRFFVHGSGKNSSNTDRRGMICVFADSSDKEYFAYDRYSFVIPNYQ